MGNVEIVMSRAGMQAVMKSAWVQGLLKEKASSIAADANSMVSEDTMDNPAFDSHVYVGSITAKANVSTASDHGEYANARDNILLKVGG